jgi:hypothetical protein
MEKAAARRAYEALHKARPFHDGSFTRWAEEPSAAFPYHFLDGVNVWASPIDLAPDDDFTTNPNAVPKGGESLGDKA